MKKLFTIIGLFLVLMPNVSMAYDNIRPLEEKYFVISKEVGSIFGSLDFEEAVNKKMWEGCEFIGGVSTYYNGRQQKVYMTQAFVCMVEVETNKENIIVKHD